MSRALVRSLPTLAVCASALLAGCGRSGGAADFGGDASVPSVAHVAAVASPTSTHGALDEVRRVPALASHLDPTMHLARVGSGYRIDRAVAVAGAPAGHFASTGARRFIGSVAAKSNGALHAGVLDDHGVERIWIEVVGHDARDAAPIDGVVVAASVVFSGALAGTDLVHVAEPSRVEELRVVHAPADALTIRYAIKASREVGEVRLRAGSTTPIVEVVDHAGKALIESEAIVAYDASGAAIEGRVSLSREGDGWGLEVHVDTAGRPFPVTVDPAWRPTSETVPTTYGVGAFGLILPNQTMQVVGDCADKTASIYDPFHDTWSTGTADPIVGDLGGLIPLSNGTVLTTAGYDCNTFYTASAATNLYNPATATTTAEGALTSSVGGVLGVQINGGPANGKVLALPNNGDSSVAEMWDPATGKWSNFVTLPAYRRFFTMSALPAGNVLVAGGVPGNGSPDGAAFVIATDGTLGATSGTPIIATPTMISARAYHTAVTLSDGSILLSGSAYAAGQSTAEIYLPTSKTFVATQPMTTARVYHTATLMPDKTVFIVGGQGTSSLSTTEIFTPNATTPANGAFVASVNLATPRENHTAVVVAGGRLLVFGGANGAASLTTAEIYTPDPVPGSSASSCATGFAADGYCCDEACTGACESCAVPGYQGICSPIVGAPIHTNTCGAYLCGGASASGDGACATTCTADTQCAAGDYCNTTTGQCIASQAQAAAVACTGSDGRQCASGNCVDGYCCDSTCTGTCQACNVVGSLGTCTAVAGTPHSGHGSCASNFACVVTSSGASGASCASTCTVDADCGSAFFCSSGACIAAKAQGASCTGGDGRQCQSGNCVDGYCCGSACGGPCQACDATPGTCASVTGTPHGSRSCAPYASCAAGSCASSCSTNADCASGKACVGGACVTPLANGATCSANDTCASGTCADGVCCATACNGACTACNVAGSVGTCTPLDGVSDLHGICPMGPCATACSKGACGFAPAGTACGTSGACTGAEYSGEACTGLSAACGPTTATACPGNLLCASATACKTGCLSDADCASGVCTAGACVAPVDAGVDAPAADVGVADSFVADTFVADTFVADTFVADTFVADTFVADTFVADTFVADTFVAETIVGGDAEIIADTPAPKLPATPIVAGFTRCDTTSQCAAGLFCVEGVCCNTPCTDTCHSCALLTSPGVCTLEPIGVDLKNECGPGLSCLGTCGATGQCIGSGAGTECARNRCTDGSHGVGPAYCAAPAAACTTDGVLAFDCGAYACIPAFGACTTTCGSTNDCADGFVCDTTSKACVATPTTKGSSGGCAVRATSTRDAGGALPIAAMAMLLGGVAARRRSQTLPPSSSRG